MTPSQTPIPVRLRQPQRLRRARDRDEALVMTEAVGHGAAFHLRFRPLFREGNEFSCPCDATGHVAMDELSERARNSYLFARAMVGRVYARPEVTAARRTEMSLA